MDTLIIYLGGAIMGKERKVILEGKDHNDTISMFRTLIEMVGMEKGESIIWAGCPGPCYAMAIFFSNSIKDKNLDIYFAANSDMNRVWQIEDLEDTGMTATKKVDHVRANLIILMSGLVYAPFENIEKLLMNGLAKGGVVIGESVVPFVFESVGWIDSIPFNYLFEFTMKEPKIIELT